MKVSIVTGCAGFIGSHMVDYLIKKKHKVIGIDNFHSGREINIKHNFKNKQFQFIKDNVENFNRIIKRIKKIDYFSFCRQWRVNIIYRKSIFLF